MTVAPAEPGGISVGEPLLAAIRRR